jgi:DNA-binding GntR family transcriptional regulator
VVRSAPDVQRFPEAETVPMADHVEARFMEWMLRDDARPGTAINELELARQFGVATTGIREFLNRFQRFGLIEKRPNAGWVFKGFTPSFALELFEIREMFELRSARAFATQPQNSSLWNQLAALRLEHVALLAEIEVRYHDFSDLDQPFPPPDQFGRAQSFHRRLLRHHNLGLSLPLPVEQARRAAAQRGRDSGASHLHRRAVRPKCLDRRTRQPGAPGFCPGDPDALHHGK